jgi:hypothetical protein
MACPECGASVERANQESHACDQGRRLDFQMMAMKPEVDAFEGRFREYLAGNEGHFEAWLAARDVRRGRGSGPAGR